ncbi:MAG: glycosyltransferase [Thermoplasmata archaeon]
MTRLSNRYLSSPIRANVGRRVSVGLFGTLFPEGGFAGNSSTGIVAALIRDERVESVTIFSQTGSYIPDALGSQKARVIPCWMHDRPSSLVQALCSMLKRSAAVDGFLFNIYPTAFGRTSIANGVGLLTPPLVALLTRKPVVVYMHNLLETQDVAQLGYRPTVLQLLGVRFLERILLRYTKVVVPLTSQQEMIADASRIIPRRVFLSFIEAFGLMSSSREPSKNVPAPADELTRILLLGSWGPQKDLDGVLRALRRAHERGGRFSVSITGAINTNFPQFRGEVNRAVASMDSEWFHSLGYVPEAKMLDVVCGHDLLILPYNATGGYSGAMSVGAYCGIGIIAYELPQLRETADELGVHPAFVPKGDVDAIVKEILSFCANVRTFRESRATVPRTDLDAEACLATARLVDLIRSPDSS